MKPTGMQPHYLQPDGPPCTPDYRPALDFTHQSIELAPECLENVGSDGMQNSYAKGRDDGNDRGPAEQSRPLLAGWVIFRRLGVERRQRWQRRQGFQGVHETRPSFATVMNAMFSSTVPMCRHNFEWQMPPL